MKAEHSRVWTERGESPPVQGTTAFRLEQTAGYIPTTATGIVKKTALVATVHANADQYGNSYTRRYSRLSGVATESGHPHPTAY